MKLTMKNIGVIRDAEIELDGITVLAGFNGTGKSTVSKALYGVIASYVDLSQRVDAERTSSVENLILNNLLNDLFEHGRVFLTPTSKWFSELANKRRPIPEQYEDWLEWFPDLRTARDSKLEKETFPKFLEQLKNAVNRPDTEYIQYLASRTMQSVFDGQINTIGSLQSGEISLTAGNGKQMAWMKIKGNRVAECTGKEISETPPIYLDTRHILGGSNESKREPPYSNELYELLKKPLSEPTFEEYKSRERVQDMIASVIHGKLTTSAFGEFMFQDDRFNEPISLRNVASGDKTFAVLQRLIENGALRTNTVLIIDEPESNQHPEWQLKLAETLVLIQRELGVRIFLTTHSTYFLRAIEVYSNRYELSNHCHYYQTQPVDDNENLFHIRNVDGQTKLIYRDFYLPFEEL